MTAGGLPATRECEEIARHTLAGLGRDLALVGFTAVRRQHGTSRVARGVCESLAARYQVRTLLVALEETGLGANRAGGLIEVLAGQADLGDAIARPAGAPFAVLGRGTAPHSLSKLLAGPEMDRCCAAMAQAFDVVVFDCPPPGTGAEALVLSRRLTNLYLVLRSGHVTLKEADQTRTLLESAGGRVSGAVLTDVPGRRRR